MKILKTFRSTATMLRVIALAMILIILCVAGVTLAQGIYDRSTATIGTTTGDGEWVNDWPYSAVELKRIWVIGNANATNVVTIQRVTSGGVYTQAVGTVTCTSNAGNTSSFTAAHLKYGDKLIFGSLINTGATAMIEYQVQQR